MKKINIKLNDYEILMNYEILIQIKMKKILIQTKKA